MAKAQTKKKLSDDQESPAQPIGDGDNQAWNFEELIKEEHSHLKKRRRGFSKDNASALCLSGGGIRSAALCLGFMRGLARKGELLELDYFSTVSGGGFSGAFVNLWIRNRLSSQPDKAASRRTVQSEIAALDGFTQMPLFHLRRYSNYLTPRTGLFSLDSLTGAIIHVRNILVNLLLILPFVLAVLLGIQAMLNLPFALPAEWLSAVPQWLFAAGAITAIVVYSDVLKLGYQVIEREEMVASNEEIPEVSLGDNLKKINQYSINYFTLSILFSLAFSFYLSRSFGVINYETTCFGAGNSAYFSITGIGCVGLGAYFLTVVFIGVAALGIPVDHYFRGRKSNNTKPPNASILKFILPFAVEAFVITTIVLLVITFWSGGATNGEQWSFKDNETYSRIVIIVGPVLIAIIHLIGQVGYLLFTSHRAHYHIHREWLARFISAQLMLPLIWLFLAFIIFYAENLLELVPTAKSTTGDPTFGDENISILNQLAALFASFATIIGAVVAIFGSRIIDDETAPNSLSQSVKRLLTRFAMYLFAVGALVLIAAVLTVSSIKGVHFIHNKINSSPLWPENNELRKVFLGVKNNDLLKDITAIFDQPALQRQGGENLTDGWRSKDCANTNNFKTIKECGGLFNPAIFQLKGEIKRLKGDIKKLKSENELLGDEIGRLDGDIKRLKCDIKRLKGEIEKLKKKRDDLKNKTTDSENKNIKEIDEFIEKIEKIFFKSEVVEKYEKFLTNITFAERSRTIFYLFFAVLSLALGIVLAKKININRFSAHDTYRNRLVRCFLGAVNQNRNPDTFTDFDANDDVPLTSLWDKGNGEHNPPLLISNMSLNAGTGSELAWQERRALPFTASAIGVGSSLLSCSSKEVKADQIPDGAFWKTELYASTGADETADEKNPTGGLKLGETIAMSGAAFNSAMGQFSSPILTIITMIFNARLGVWLGNPANPKTYQESYPKNAITPLISEWTSNTVADSDFVNISDGGHFDNLGLYEMLRRRCQSILVVDGGADPNLELADLGRAIRMAKLDSSFGIEVEFDANEMNELRDPDHSRMLAVAKLTYHSKPEKKRLDGKLFYFKPKNTENLPPEVSSYAAKNPKFPHQPTTDQWFGESQFNAYLELGEVLASLYFK